MSLSVPAMGDVATLVRCHMNGSIPFMETIEQIAETMSLALNQ